MNLKLAGSLSWLSCFSEPLRQWRSRPGAIGEPIVLQTTALPKGFLRQPYHFKLEAQGGILPLRWEITAGAPPPGIDLSPDGNLTGAPTEVDSFHFVVTITDSGKPVARKKENSLSRSSLHWSSNGARSPRSTAAEWKARSRCRTRPNRILISLSSRWLSIPTDAPQRSVTSISVLKKNTEEFEIPFGENLPFGAYDLHADAVAEVAATNTIYRVHLATAEKLQVQQGP